MAKNSIIVILHDGPQLIDDQAVTLGTVLHELGLKDVEIHTLSHKELVHLAVKNVIDVCKEDVPTDLKHAIVYLSEQIGFNSRFGQHLMDRIVVCNEKHLDEEKNALKTAVSIIANKKADKTLYNTKTAKQYNFTETIHQKCRWLNNVFF